MAGFDAPRSTSSGTGLPSARAVSNMLFAHTNPPNSTLLNMVHMTFGQFIDHDLDIAPEAKLMNDVTGELADVFCGDDDCETNTNATRNCLPIDVPPGDPLFADRMCLKFVRSEAIQTDECSPSPRQQVNDINSFLDVSAVYGDRQDLADYLRTKSDGLLKTSPHPINPDFLPLMFKQREEECRGVDPTAGVECFLSGTVVFSLATSGCFYDISSAQETDAQTNTPSLLLCTPSSLATTTTLRKT